MNQAEIDDKEWHRAANWHGGLLGVYASTRDSRVWVPKRRLGLGWTLNFGHRNTPWSLASMLVGSAVLVGALRRLKR
jgi:uncharacterized membrane protein